MSCSPAPLLSLVLSLSLSHYLSLSLLDRDTKWELLPTYGVPGPMAMAGKGRGRNEAVHVQALGGGHSSASMNCASEYKAKAYKTIGQRLNDKIPAQIFEFNGELIQRRNKKKYSWQSDR